MGFKVKFFDNSYKKLTNKFYLFEDLEETLAAIQNIKDELNAEKVVFLNQKHTDKFVIIDENFVEAVDKEDLKIADALITNQTKIALAIYTADCVPILLVDTKNKIIAAIHAGYPGAKSELIDKTIKAMISKGSEHHNMQAFIGPCIRQKSYQVSKEFYNEFIAIDKGYAEFFIADNIQDKFLFDLPGFIKAKLKANNINKIIDKNEDSYSLSNYASYRKATHEKQKLTKNILSVIMLEDENNK